MDWKLQTITDGIVPANFDIIKTVWKCEEIN